MNITPSRLRFEADSRRWFLESDDGVWALEAIGDPTTLASYLEIIVESSSSRPALQGKASLRPGDSTEHELVLKSLQGGAEQAVLPLWPVSVSTATSEWSFGLHEDNWLECEAELILGDTQKVGFTFYLPERPGLIEKALTFHLDGRSLSEVELSRGELQEHWVDIPDDARSYCRLTLQSSYEEPILVSEDDRSLGVILVRINLDNTMWKDVEAI